MKQRKINNSNKSNNNNNNSSRIPLVIRAQRVKGINLNHNNNYHNSCNQVNGIGLTLLNGVWYSV